MIIAEIASVNRMTDADGIGYSLTLEQLKNLMVQCPGRTVSVGFSQRVFGIVDNAKIIDNVLIIDIIPDKKYYAALVESKDYFIVPEFVMSDKCRLVGLGLVESASDKSIYPAYYRKDSKCINI